jgi:hypothetical protein
MFATARLRMLAQDGRLWLLRVEPDERALEPMVEGLRYSRRATTLNLPVMLPARRVSRALAWRGNHTSTSRRR